MTTLFTMAETCALAPNIAVAWLDAPVQINNLERGEHKADAYLAINSKGKVPALQFDDGDVLTEATAILSWLGSRYGSSELARDSMLGRKEAEALSYMSSEVHASYGPHFNAAGFAESEEAQREVKAKTYDKLRAHYQNLDRTLESNGGEWYLGQRTFADAYLYVLTRWIEKTPISLNDYAALRGFRDKMEQDAGVAIALKRQAMTVIGNN